MFPQRQQIPGFGAVAEALFRCIPRHGACERHCPFVPRFPSCGTFPSFHLPKVRGIPAFSPHLPKVRNRQRPSVAPVRAFSFPAAFSHLPKVCIFSVFSAHLPKVRSFPAFSAHLPKVRNRQGSSVAPVPAFPFPVASFHLPKVRGIPAFPPHLPEVRTGMGCRITGCMYDFYTIFKKLDTCRMNFIQLNVFENCSSGYDTVTYSIRHNFCNE